VRLSIERDVLSDADSLYFVCLGPAIVWSILFLGRDMAGFGRALAGCLVSSVVLSTFQWHMYPPCPCLPRRTLQLGLAHPLVVVY
jgi:hypothetical protein